MDFNWFICSCQLFSYEQKREINSRLPSSQAEGKLELMESDAMSVSLPAFKGEKFNASKSQA